MAEKYYIKKDGDIDKCLKVIDLEATKNFNEGNFSIVTIYSSKDDKIRTIQQNRLAFQVYNVLGDAAFGGDSELARRYCKLHYGCGILYADSEFFAGLFDKIIRPLEYKNQLEAMDILNVTREFTIKQFERYLSDMFKGITNKGVDLSSINFEF